MVSDGRSAELLQKEQVPSTSRVSPARLSSQVSVCSDPDWAVKFFIRWEKLSASVLSLAVKGPHILAYFGSHGDSNERDIVGMYHQSTLDFSGNEQQNALTAAVLCLVMQHFKEKESSLIWHADVSTFVLFYPYY